MQKEQKYPNTLNDQSELWHFNSISTRLDGSLQESRRERDDLGTSLRINVQAASPAILCYTQASLSGHLQDAERRLLWGAKDEGEQKKAVCLPFRYHCETYEAQGFRKKEAILHHAICSTRTSSRIFLQLEDIPKDIPVRAERTIHQIAQMVRRRGCS